MMSKRILIADDMANGRELIRTILERSGYLVMEAEDGQEALEAADRELPDLIILDVQMPVLNGYEVLARLRGDPRFTALPIIALTANAMQGDRDKALKAGFSAYVPKPVSLAQLREQVSILLA